MAEKKAKEGLPAQGAKALMNAWDDANKKVLTSKQKEMLKNATKEPTKEEIQRYLENW